MAVPFGKYQLLRKIASGGMGQVFLALERGAGLERLVVLKLILPHLAEDEDFLAMFLEEARLVARLAHPNLITILELTEIDGRHCLAMEYVQGDDVRRLEKYARAQGKPLPVGLVLRIIAEAAAGLNYAHQARNPQGQPLHLVHRDVSPQNILVGFDGGVKVIDFGVAKAAGSASNTATGVLKGKYPYMSPEQANGQHVDARSDLFALGVVLWEMLTGRRLFKGESDLMTLRLVRDCLVPPPSQLNPKLPPGVDELVLRALAPTPEGRFPDCGAFRLAIENYILQYRLPASNAHLSAYLRDLYTERITRESDPANLDQLAEDADLDSKSNSSRSNARSGSQQGAGPRISTPAGTGTPVVPPPRPLTKSKSKSKNSGPHTLSLPPAPEPKRRVPRVAVLASVGTLLVCAGAAIVMLRQQPAGVAQVLEPTPVVRTQLAPVPTEPPAPLEPRPLKTLKLLSEPPGAWVVVDGKQYGPTPMELPLRPDAPKVTVAVKMDGYETQEHQLSADNAPEFLVKLRQKPRRNPAALGIKTGR
ncbi:MAG TPA: protein kinase [Archangium sp.]|nr:protein kinase [Archangium sp.]